MMTMRLLILRLWDRVEVSELLSRELRELGVDVRQCYIVSLLICRP